MPNRDAIAATLEYLYGEPDTESLGVTVANYRERLRKDLVAEVEQLAAIIAKHTKIDVEKVAKGLFRAKYRKHFPLLFSAYGIFIKHKEAEEFVVQALREILDEQN